MPLITVVVWLMIVGVILWLINAYVPMDEKIKTILNIVVVLAVVLWLLQTMNVIGPILLPQAR